MSIRAAVYIRQSQTSEGTISPALQREHVERFIKEQGWTQVPEVFEDIDISGRSEANRPGFLRLKKAYAEGAFDVAVADEERKAAELAVLNATAAKDGAQAKINSLLSRMVTLGLTDAEVAGPLAAFRAELEKQSKYVQDALVVQSSLVPASDLSEVISKGSEGMSVEEWRNAVGKVLSAVIVLEDRRVLVVPKGKEVTIW